MNYIVVALAIALVLTPSILPTYVVNTKNVMGKLVRARLEDAIRVNNKFK